MCAQHDAIKFELLRASTGYSVEFIFVFRLVLVRAFRCADRNRREAHPENFAQSLRSSLFFLHFVEQFSRLTLKLYGSCL